MKPGQLFSQKHNCVIKVSLISVFLLTAIALKSQTPANFSGKWELDTTKSTFGKLDTKYDGTITRTITQNSSIITFSDLYTSQGNKDWSTSNESYDLDGNEHIKKDASGVTKTIAKWSQDKRSLTITITETDTPGQESKVFIFAYTYKLSDDGRTLTIEEYYKNDIIGEGSTKKVYHKK